MQKLQIVTKKIVRQSPKVVALVGAAGIGAFLMARYHGNMNHLVLVHRGIAATAASEGEAVIFHTLLDGSFVLAPVQQV
jgi:hypothetical protein